MRLSYGFARLRKYTLPAISLLILLFFAFFGSETTNKRSPQVESSPAKVETKVETKDKMSDPDSSVVDGSKNETGQTKGSSSASVSVTADGETKSVDQELKECLAGEDVEVSVPGGNVICKSDGEEINIKVQSKSDTNIRTNLHLEKND